MSCITSTEGPWLNQACRNQETNPFVTLQWSAQWLWALSPNSSLVGQGLTETASSLVSVKSLSHKVLRHEAPHTPLRLMWLTSTLISGTQIAHYAAPVPVPSHSPEHHKNTTCTKHASICTRQAKKKNENFLIEIEHWSKTKMGQYILGGVWDYSLAYISLKFAGNSWQLHVYVVTFRNVEDSLQDFF